MSQPAGPGPAGALKKEDQAYGQRLAEMAKKHSSEASLRPGRSSGGGGLLGAGVAARELEERSDRSGHTTQDA